MGLKLTKEERERLEKASEEVNEIFKKYGIQGFSFIVLKEKDASSLLSVIDETSCDRIAQRFGYNLFQMHKLLFGDNLPVKMRNAVISIMLGTEFCKKLLSDGENFTPFFQKNVTDESQLN